MTKKYRVRLTLAERKQLERLLSRSKADVRRLKRALILLKADQADAASEQDPRPSSSSPGRTCWRFTPAPLIPSGPCYAGTRPSSS